MKKEKLNYIKPKKYHIVIDDIQKFMDKHIKDPRSNDKFFFRTEVKDFMERMGENTELLRNSSKISRDMVYMMGVQFVVMMICQLTLFQRIIVSHKNHNYGSETYGEDLPTLPKNFVPLFMKMYDKGKVVDFSDTHTLSLMKKWYLSGGGKEDKILREMDKWIKENTFE